VVRVKIIIQNKVLQASLTTTSEAQIAVHWQEEGYYYPSKEFIAQANMTDESIYDRFRGLN
jgi:acetyl-CoA synthetase